MTSVIKRLAEGEDLVWHALTGMQITATPTQSRYRAMFAQKDNRIWQAVIAPSSNTQSWLVSFSSAGCREYSFLASTLNTAKKAANAFAQLDQVVYNRLVADAKPTTTHPATGADVVLLAVPLSTIRREGDMAKPTAYLGQINPDHTFKLYPSNKELKELLYNFGDMHSVVPLFDETLREVSIENVQEELQRTDLYDTLGTAVQRLSKTLFVNKPTRRTISL
jgi:hypothetical protein